MPIILIEVAEAPSTYTSTELSELESQILEELGEDIDDPQVWAGTVDLREGLADALDEMSMVMGCFKTKLVIKLEADIGFYEIALGDGYPLWVTEARLYENDNRLLARTVGQLSAEDERFLMSRGTPRAYASITPDVVLFAPCPSVDTDVVVLSVVYAPYHYGTHNEYINPRVELEKGLVHYGKYFKLLGVKGSFETAMYEYEEYLKTLNLLTEVKSHSQGLRKLRFADQENVRYGQKVS